MTTRQKIESQLYEMGIFESDASKIMDYAIPLVDAEMTEMNMPAITWNLPANGYPDMLYQILFTSIGRHVLAWAEDNMPMAWWKPMFLPAQEREALFAGILPNHSQQCSVVYYKPQKRRGRKPMQPELKMQAGTVSLRPDQWQKLRKYSNQSSLIRDLLDAHFLKQKQQVTI